MSQPRRRTPLPLRTIGFAIVAIVLLWLGWSAWQRSKAADSAGAFRTETVQRGDIRVAISYPARKASMLDPIEALRQ